MLKYLRLIFSFQDVANAWREEGLIVTSKSFLLSRRFWGAVVLFANAVVFEIWGIKIAPEETQNFTDGLLSFFQASTTLYGAVMVIHGYIKRSTQMAIKSKTRKIVAPENPKEDGLGV